MSTGLWNDLEDIDHFYDCDGNYTDEVIEEAYDALEDSPSNVWLTDKAREALHGDPIRAYERQQSLVAAGDPHALAIAEACRRWLAAQNALSTIELQKGA